MFSPNIFVAGQKYWLEINFIRPSISMIETKKNRKNVRVTFILPKDESLGKVSVVGDFNDWKPGETQLTNRKNDHLSATVRLEKDSKYAFRYLSEERGWFDDEAAHDYERGPFGSTNSIILT